MSFDIKALKQWIFDSSSFLDLDERILKQQQEEEERKRQRREKKKEKKVSITVSLI